MLIGIGHYKCMLWLVGVSLSFSACSLTATNRKIASDNESISGEVCPAVRQIPRDELLVVLTFNVLKGYGSGSKSTGRIESTREIIRQVSPDIIGLQELYREEGQEDSPNTLEDMQIPLMNFGPEWDYSYYGSGMILSRGKILEHYEPSAYRRNWGALIHIKRTHFDFKFRYYNVHLHYKDAGWELLHASKNPESEIEQFVSYPGVQVRLNELNHILEQVQILRKNVIIGGDFNSGSHLDWNRENEELASKYPFLNSKNIDWKESHSLMANGFTDSFRALNPLSKVWGATWSPLYKNSPHERIDYIYYKNNDEKIRLEPICSQVLGESPQNASLAYSGQWPSDHRALVTTFHIQEKP